MTFNGWTFLLEAVNFVVLAYVLHRLLYRPLRDAVEQRRAAADRARADTEKARAEAALLQERLRSELANLEQQRQDAVHQARERAEAERQELLAETERTIGQCREESRLALERERSETLRALRQEVIAQAVDLTRRLLKEAADQTLHHQLVARLVQTLTDLPDAEREQLRTHWTSADGALLETAQELDRPTLEGVQKAVKDLVGTPVALTVQARPALLGGARLRVGGHVWDGSLSGQLPEPATSEAVP